MYKLGKPTLLQGLPLLGGGRGAGQAEAIRQEHSKNWAEAGPRWPAARGSSCPREKNKTQPKQGGGGLEPRPNFKEEEQAGSRLAHHAVAAVAGGRKQHKHPHEALWGSHQHLKGGQAPPTRKSANGNNSNRPRAAPFPLRRWGNLAGAKAAAAALPRPPPQHPSAEQESGQREGAGCSPRSTPSPAGGQSRQHPRAGEG